MEMNYLLLEYIWKTKKEEMKRESAYRETYKLYPEFNKLKWKLKKD